MMDLFFTWKGLVTTNDLLQDFKAAKNVWNIREGATVLLFKHYSNGSLASVIKAPVVSSAKMAFAQDDC